MSNGKDQRAVWMAFSGPPGGHLSFEWGDFEGMHLEALVDDLKDHFGDRENDLRVVLIGPFLGYILDLKMSEHEGEPDFSNWDVLVSLLRKAEVIEFRLTDGEWVVEGGRTPLS